MKKLMIALVIALTTISLPATAEFRIATLNKSWHYSESKPISHNETHNGIGIEFAVTEGLYLGVLRYENSLYQRSTMINLTAEYPYKDIVWGPMAALADGYGRDGDHYLMIAGVSVRYKWIRFTITPVLVAVGLVFSLN